MPRKRHGATRTLTIIVSIGAVLAAAGPAVGQVDADRGVWTAVSMQSRVSEGSAWRWASDSLVRTRDGAGSLDFVAERVMAVRDLTRRSSVGVGYAFAAGFPASGPLHEHRLVQQYEWRARPRLALKTRLEERFVTGQEAMLRLRQQLRVTWPLAPRKGLDGVVSDEVFVRVGPAAREAPRIERNQLFLGVRGRVTRRIGMEIGYVNVYRPAAAQPSRRSHVVSATLMVSL